MNPIISAYELAQLSQQVQRCLVQRAIANDPTPYSALGIKLQGVSLLLTFSIPRSIPCKVAELAIYEVLYSMSRATTVQAALVIADLAQHVVKPYGMRVSLRSTTLPPMELNTNV